MAAAVGWADLSVELLAIILGCLEAPIDITRFGSVCRSWRISIPNNKNKHSNPNKLSPFFPQRFCRTIVTARAVFLLRPCLDPSKAWIVTVQESKPGILRLRHPLTYEDIPCLSGNSIDLSGWTITQLAMSQHTVDKFKTVISVPMRVRDPKPMALYFKYILSQGSKQLCAFSPGLGDEAGKSPRFVVHGVPKNSYTMDCVNFNGRVYVVDSRADVYVFDYPTTTTTTTLQLLPLKCDNFLPDSLRERRFGIRFVVSDGDLYIVLKFCLSSCTWPPVCHVYKLVMMDDGGIVNMCCRLEKVENLGDRIFIINQDCAFSVSARELPHRPLAGNCILLDSYAFRWCDCFRNFGVYYLGEKPPEFGLMSSVHVYSALFTPPSLWMNQLQRGYSK